MKGPHRCGHLPNNVGNIDSMSDFFTFKVLGLQTLQCAGKKVKVKFSHTRYRALGPELIPVYRQSDSR